MTASNISSAKAQAVLGDGLDLRISNAGLGTQRATAAAMESEAARAIRPGASARSS
jgi:hypothetical protein